MLLHCIPCTLPHFPNVLISSQKSFSQRQSATKIISFHTSIVCSRGSNLCSRQRFFFLFAQKERNISPFRRSRKKHLQKRAHHVIFFSLCVPSQSSMRCVSVSISPMPIETTFRILPAERPASSANFSFVFFFYVQSFCVHFHAYCADNCFRHSTRCLDFGVNIESICWFL